MIHRLARKALFTFSAKRALERLERSVPFLRGWHRFAYHEHFEHLAAWERLFEGVYPTFAAALAHVPASREIGYDHPAAAQFLGRRAPVVPSDYPVLYWLGEIFSEGSVLVDFGGYLGIAYNTFKAFDIFPATYEWVVYDVPAVVAAGRAYLAADPDPHLHFTTAFGVAASADIVLAAGSLQFCEDSLAERLASLPRLPMHVLVNKLPVSERAFVTLQNMGPSISPYRIFARSDFASSLARLGYRQIDAWEVAELGCYIPFHPECCLDHFSGFYFRHESASVSRHETARRLRR